MVAVPAGTATLRPARWFTREISTVDQEDLDGEAQLPTAKIVFFSKQDARYLGPGRPNMRQLYTCRGYGVRDTLFPSKRPDRSLDRLPESPKSVKRFKGGIGFAFIESTAEGIGSKRDRDPTLEKMKSISQIRAGRSRFPDQFDRVPDPLILIIFNKLADARSLGRCAAVSRRFRSLVPLVDDVYVKIDRVVTVDGDSCRSLTLSFPRPRKCFSHFLKLMLFAILRPIRNLHNPHCVGKRFLPQVSHRSPAQVLKNFRHVRRLRIELPAGDVRTEDGALLRWRAEFGSTLESCVILGGTRTERLPPSSGRAGQAQDDGSMPESFYTNGGLKLRVVWAIGTLIAASTRHYLLQEIIEDHPTLESLVLTDADGQGTLSMGLEQLKEFREKPLVASASSTRTHLPASNMKLRYAPYLELPEGMAMQGATLVAISPATDDTDGNSSREECDPFIRGAFEGPLGAAVKSLVERRIYLMEINGF
ncbi:hypothetical protein B296_00033660 [Ensete ventricosum]|uniref:F-box domain-containing protein n=1 Tax=Ensete ventricosum TaxID=4639 RepID=A0A427AAF5_ENSVE|nr:hypothetical protein B296_00033660 [Ensete ventricosum]